jgi:16S rRNA (cytidine1402-2'-O)-methyltransferase
MGDSHMGKLVVCATPIGNLGDASPRLAEALAGADLVACEDTRQTRKLLAHLGVRARLVSYHEANEASRAAQLADEIAAGARVALVSDAGMPAVSDPGHDLIGACLERGLAVEVVPGPSAVLAALVASGLPTHRFSFEGFPPRKPSARARALEELAGERRTMVFFEAPHRVLATLDAMIAAFGAERRCAVTRELTKLHEQVLRGTLGELRDRLAGQGQRGEFTLVVTGAPEAPDGAAQVDVVAAVADLVAAGASTRDAVATVARTSGRPRRAVYQAVLEAREFASLPGQDTRDSQDTRAAGERRSGEGRPDDQSRSQERLR